jgi:hypothetical protein
MTPEPAPKFAGRCWRWLSGPTRMSADCCGKPSAQRQTNPICRRQSSSSFAASLSANSCWTPWLTTLWRRSAIAPSGIDASWPRCWLRTSKWRPKRSVDRPRGDDIYIHLHSLAGVPCTRMRLSGFEPETCGLRVGNGRHKRAVARRGSQYGYGRRDTSRALYLYQETHWRTPVRLPRRPVVADELIADSSMR